jgi:hypothetical protein
MANPASPGLVVKVFAYRKSVGQFPGKTPLPDAEYGHRANMRGEGEDRSYPVFIESPHPAGSQVAGMGREHQVSAGNGCVLDGIQDTAVTVPGHGPDIVGTDDEEKGGFLDLRLVKGRFREFFPSPGVPYHDHVPCLEISGARCRGSTVKEIGDLVVIDRFSRILPDRTPGGQELKKVR